MIKLIALAALAACPLTARVTTHSYNVDTVKLSCATDFQFQKGVTKITIPGDGIFKNGFEQ